jgi:hypothetical protein
MSFFVIHARVHRSIPLPVAFGGTCSNHTSLSQAPWYFIFDDFIINLTIGRRLRMKKKSEKCATVLSSHESAVESNPKSMNGKHEEIARLAYSYWEVRAGLGGSPEEDWFQAEREIQIQKSRLQCK